VDGGTVVVDRKWSGVMSALVETEDNVNWYIAGCDGGLADDASLLSGGKMNVKDVVDAGNGSGYADIGGRL